MKATLTTIGLVLMLAGVAAADVFTGIVLSREDGKPLPAATITVDGTGLQVKADDSGRFELVDVSGPVAVSVSHVGFASVKGIALTAGEPNRIALEPSLSVLNSIVVTANRYEKEAYKVSQPITALNADQIETKGYPIVSDVIREFPGVDMNDAGPFRSRPVIRGLYGTRILVLVDGQRLNDQRDVSDFAGVSMSLVDPSEIQRVEVVNGPSSVLYGSDAMAGVVNIITRKEEFNGEPKPFVRYSGRYSTADEQHSNRIDAGVEAKRYAVSFGAQYREALKDFEPPSGWQTNERRYGVFSREFYDSLNAARGTDYSRDRLVNSRARINNYSAGFAFKYSDKQRFDLDWGAFRGRDIGYPGVPNVATPFLFFYPAHDRDHFSLSYTGTALTRHVARFEGRLYYDKIAKDFYTDFLDAVRVTFGASGVNPLTSMNRTEIAKIGLNVQELHQLSEKTTLTFGVDSWTEKIRGDVSSTTEYTGPAFGLPPGVSKDSTTEGSSVPNNRWYSLGLYSSGELTVSRWQVTAGARLDNFWIRTETTPGYVDLDNGGALLPTENQNYTALTGSLGLVCPIGRGVNGVANLGTAYRVPNVVERFYYGSASNRQTRPNPDIKPERSVTLDAGFKGVHPNISYSLIGFWSDYNDFTQLQNFDSLPPSHPGGDYTRLWRYENVQDVTIYGVETVIDGQLDMGLFSNLSLSYQHGQNDTDNQPLFVSPFKMSVTGGYRHKSHGLFGEVTVRIAGDQNRIPDVAALDDIATEGFTILSVTAGVNIYRQVRLAVTGLNLTDEVYSEPFNGRNPDNPIPESGRNFVITLNSSF